jgi:trans-aconitate 2-methyltransferase
VDVVFSNAVFHWIPDDDALFSALFRATKPGGRLRAQCGGATNNARLMAAADDVAQRAPYAEYLGNQDLEPRKYRTPEEAQTALERNGWTDVKAQLFESPVAFEDTDAAVLYLRTIILQPQVSHLPEDLGKPHLRDVVAEVIRRHGDPFVADYVRLDIWAHRA